MGSGLPPGPRTGLHDAGAIDDGTLARIGSPAPGAVGASGKGPSAGAKTSDGTMVDAIVGYAAQRLGHHEPDGQCFALVDHALREAGARSAADFGPVVPGEDYVWGIEVSLSDLTRGDVVQFRDYVYQSVVVTETSEGTSTEDWSEGRLHHSAIVERAGENGAVTVLEQNSPDGAPVTRTMLYFRSGESEADGRTTTITVSGTLWFYRPQPR